MIYGTFSGLDLCCTDPAQCIVTTGDAVDDLLRIYCMCPTYEMYKVSFDVLVQRTLTLT